MNKNDLIKFWLALAKDDLKTAENLLKAKDYAWCLFIMHLVIEKTLKAFWIRDNKEDVPPKTHNLLKLAEETKLDLSGKHKLLLLDINDFNIEARYPDYKRNFHKKCTGQFSRQQFELIREFYKWLLKQK